MANHNPKVATKPWEGWGISKEKFDAYEASRRQWGSHAPKIGDEAPDFEIERLTAEGDRTGEMFRFSSSKGRPVALCMGSYT